MKTTPALLSRFACLLIGGFSFSLVHAQQRGGAPAGPPRLGFRVAPPTYQQSCGTCHGTQGTVTDGKKAPSIGELQEYSPERVYSVLNATHHRGPRQSRHFLRSSKAAVCGVSLRTSDEQRGGRLQEHDQQMRFEPDDWQTPQAGLRGTAGAPAVSNARFQTAANAGLTAQQVPNLKLKWAFGVPNATEMYSQPTVVSGRVFFGSDAAWLYSLDAKTGCIYWSFGADAGIRATPVIAPIKVRARRSTRFTSPMC